MYSRVNRKIQVSVQPVYLEEQSTPEENKYVWAYHINITNKGKETVQLVSRYWNITDSNGYVKEVRGKGVVGEQPVLAPGESFEYTSGTPLQASSGIMLGTYQMVTDKGEKFDIDIPPFSLDIPGENNQVN